MKRKSHEVLAQIRRTVAKTLALVQPVMIPSRRTSPVNPFFELYGFDLLLDRDFRMWLLEINTCPAMGFEEEVDFAVKAPLLAHCLSIIGIPDEIAANLRTSRIVVEHDQLERFEAELVQQEDLRNAEAGNGFTRIFPSEEMADLEYLLITPPYTPQAPEKREQKGLNPRKLGPLLTSDQASQILIDFIEQLRADDANRPKIEKFLRAQGYKITRNQRSFGSALAKFTATLQSIHRSAEQPLPEPISRIIMTSGHDFLGQLLANCHLPGVNDIKTLFTYIALCTAIFFASLAR
jgi:hypothetical protein